MRRMMIALQSEGLLRVATKMKFEAVAAFLGNANRHKNILLR